MLQIDTFFLDLANTSDAFCILYRKSDVTYFSECFREYLHHATKLPVEKNYKPVKKNPVYLEKNISRYW